jgi:mannose-6-phosphate isomerase-like protein (cupin superfamily)
MMAAIVRGERRAFGPIVNDVSGLAQTLRQVGGEGVCRWKMLMNGMHLEGQWNSVEYVLIEPGASVGEHVHARTEEIYYVVSGRAVVSVDGAEIKAGSGDLITAPIGAVHSIANRGTEDMCFFVVEAFPCQGPPAKPAWVHVPDLLVDIGGLRAAELDLKPHFTGDWQRFRLIEIPASGQLEERTAPDRSEVVHVLDGTAAITVDGQHHQGGPGLSAAIPPGTAWSAANAAGSEVLRLIATELAVA